MPRATTATLGNECLRNGRTFLALSGLAEVRGEFGHAYSLTILAWEELAKCFAYRLVETGAASFETDPNATSAIILLDRHILNRHREKHLVVAASLFGMQVADAFGAPQPDTRMQPVPLDFSGLDQISPEQVSLALPEGLRPGDLPGLADRVRATPRLIDGVLKLAGEAKAWNDAKNKGFYVDDSEAGMGSPWDVGEAELSALKALFERWYGYNRPLLEGIPTPVLAAFRRLLPSVYDPAKTGRRVLLCTQCAKERFKRAPSRLGSPTSTI